MGFTPSACNKMVYRHHPREVAAQLNLREFTALCSYLDANYGPTKPGRRQLIANGYRYFSNTLEVKATRGAVKFNIVRIQRSADQLILYIDLGGGAVKKFDMSNIVASIKKLSHAALPSERLSA